MDVVVTKSELVQLARSAAGVTESKSPMALLLLVLLDAADGKLSARATNLYLGLDAHIHAKVKAPGQAAVDARKLAELVKALPDGEVAMRLKGDVLELKSGKSTKFRIATCDASDYPQLPRLADASPVFTVGARELSRAISQGSHAMGVDASRENLSATLLSFVGDVVRVVSTDGARMGTSDVHVTRAADAKPVELLVPTKGVGEIRKLAADQKDGDVGVHVAGRVAFVTAGSYALSVTLVDSGYVPWERVMPKSCEHTVRLDREELSAVLKRVSLVAGASKGGGVVLSFGDGRMRLSGGASTVAESEDEIECECAFDIRIGCNPALLDAAVSALSGECVTIELSGALDPIVLAGDGARHVVMPMRLDAA